MDEAAVISGLIALGRDPASASDVRRLSGGASGAGVFGLHLDGVGVVLKVSAKPDASGAGRELRFYRELADRVPVHSPPFLAGATADGHDVLLLGPAAPAPPAREWDQSTWVEVARQLGRLHRSLSRGQLERRSWLGREADSEQTVDERQALWRFLPCAEIAAALLADLESLTAGMAGLPRCLIHGDCHAQNLLLAPSGELVWADWQEVGYGHGPEDLALLWQRAQFNGASPPRAATLAAYADERGIRLDQTLRRAVTAAELRLLLMGWPAFLLREPSAGRDGLLALLQQLHIAWCG